MKLVTGILLLVLVGACSENENEIKDLRGDEPIIEHDVSNDKTTKGEPISSPKPIDSNAANSTSEWSYEVVLISENNWGYQLFQSGKMIINQTSIPSIQGIAGFDSREKAERTAKYILTEKLEKGIFPPTVNKQELESLKVLRN